MKKTLVLAIVAVMLSAGSAMAQSPRVIHTNDGSIDVYTLEYCMALASADEIDLVGIIADQGAGYISVEEAYTKPKIWDKGRQQCTDIVGKARRSGMINIPDPVAGAGWALDAPASEVIEDTTPLNTPGSQLIVQEANNSTPANPLYIVTGGALTCVADAYLLDNSITDKVVVVSLFSHTSGMGGYNGDIDGWAAYVVLEKFRYIQFCGHEHYDPDTPKSRMAGTEIPENELRRLMIDKDQYGVALPEDRDADAPPAIYIMRPDYVLTSSQVSFGGWQSITPYGNGYPKTPLFQNDSAGNATVITSADKALSTDEWWRAMGNSAAYSGTVIQQSPFNGTALVVPCIIQTEDFDWGGKGYAFYETEPTSWPLYRVDLNMQAAAGQGTIEECLDVDGGYNLINTTAGEWWEYTINLSEAGVYNIALRIASDVSNCQVHLEFDGVDKTGVINIPNTGGLQNWQGVSVNNVSLSAGEQVMRLCVDSGGFNINYIDIGGDPGTVPVLIPQAGWSLLYVDSEELNYAYKPATYSFDGNTDTFWHTEWYESSHPHEIQIDLGGFYDICGFRYLPRQDEGPGDENGMIKDYEFYVRGDGVAWGAAVASGTFSVGKTEKQVLFGRKLGKCVRLIAISEVNDNPWTTMAELNVLAVHPDTDINNDGKVNIEDFAALAVWWDDDNGCVEPDWCGGADFDMSGTVDFTDLAYFVENWLRMAN